MVDRSLLHTEGHTSFWNLRQQANIAFKATDKDFAVVVLSKEDHIKEAGRQLNNQDY